MSSRRKYKTAQARYLAKIQTRWSDQKYNLSCLIYHTNHNINPEFTEKDLQKKLEIFEVPNLKTCFITKNSAKGTGDHLYEINGYAKHDNGRHGTDDDWNKLPVCGGKNKSYKVFGQIKKNIGYQDLTNDEILECTEEQIDIYEKIEKWKSYVNERGATLFWVYTQKEKDMYNKLESEYKALWDKDKLLNMLEIG